jgi:CDP-diacylglycerol--glycerol-3-phosphate 3-phosphatidyltransferase
MNLPNKLTVSRFVLTVLFLWALFSPIRFNDTVALVLFSLAGFTDFLDGRIARKRGLITNFGILMDPLADKVLICSAFVAFVETTHLNATAPVKVAAWMVIVIVARELTITGLRLLAASKNVVLAAENFGKHKTISQIVAINALLVVDACNEWPARLQTFSCPGCRCSRKSCCGWRSC